MAPARPRLCAVLGLLLCGLRPAAAMAAGDERRSASPVAATACWRVEDFVVAQECGPCSGFQMTVPECSPTGFVERITCAGSRRAELKSCRSAHMESRRFWSFVVAMLAVGTVAAGLVRSRQRALDTKAQEKVRKQLECV